jgi:hypothetical protein
MLLMKTKSCVYCGDACEETVSLDWSVPDATNNDTVAVRLVLCERCSRSWTAFTADFCPEAVPERRLGAKRKKGQA